jgi:hypothetical protein
VASARSALNAQDVVRLFAAAICNDAGVLFASPFDRDMRSNANRIFTSNAHATVRRVFERRRRYARSSVFVPPQDIDPRHQGNLKLGPFFTHAFSIGKKLKMLKSFLCVLCVLFVEIFLNAKKTP